MQVMEQLDKVEYKDYSRVVDDLLFLLTLCGNDFLPQIPFLSMDHYFIPFIIKSYCTSFANHFIVNKDEVDIHSVKDLLTIISKVEWFIYDEMSVEYVESLKTVALWRLSKEEDYKKVEQLNKIISVCNGGDMEYKDYKKYYYFVKLQIDMDGIIRFLLLIIR